jgi:hypothetical protein
MQGASSEPHDAEGFAALTVVADESVLERTGRSWTEWFELLDAAGSRGMSHQEIVALVARRYALDPWWQQAVTVAYERATGLRAMHQRADGFAVGVTRTMAASAERVFQAITDEFVREAWLPAQPLLTSGMRRKANGGNWRVVRASWRDGTRVIISVVPRGTGRAQVQVEHEQLRTSHDVERYRAFWKARLDLLQELCER